MPFASPLKRSPPPYVATERAALTARLDYHRATLLWKLDGLDDEQLRRAMVPSGLSLLGIVKHLTQVEHGWFVRGFAGIDEPLLFSRNNDPDADFRIGDRESTAAVVDGYLRMCERGREVVTAAASLDEVVEHPSRGKIDLRWILLHMIEETARHNGHADVIREFIDGQTGE